MFKADCYNLAISELQKTLKPKAQLFKLEANLLTNGNVELTYDSVRPEDFERYNE